MTDGQEPVGPQDSDLVDHLVDTPNCQLASYMQLSLEDIFLTQQKKSDLIVFCSLAFCIPYLFYYIFHTSFTSHYQDKSSL